MRRIPPSGAAVPAPLSTGFPFPQCVTEALQQVTKAVRNLSHSRTRVSYVKATAEWQPLLDCDVFCMASDKRTTRLNPLQQYNLINLLAQFFAERTEDSNKYAYFETIFLGRDSREADTTTHRHRIQVLYKVASFALEYPVLTLFVQISQWLSQMGPSKPYAEELITSLVRDYNTKRMLKKVSGFVYIMIYWTMLLIYGGNSFFFKFLLPLEVSCAEFTVFFVCYAPRVDKLTPYMASVVGCYMTRNHGYMLSQFRDSPKLAEFFAKQTFPILLEFSLSVEEFAGERKLQTWLLTLGVEMLCSGWHTKIKDIFIDITSIFNGPRATNANRDRILKALVGPDIETAKIYWKMFSDAKIVIPETCKTMFAREKRPTAMILPKKDTSGLLSDGELEDDDDDKDWENYIAGKVETIGDDVEMVDEA